MDTRERTLADYIAILRRRLTVVLFSFVAVLVGGVYFAYSLPGTYRSTGTILIEQQDISTDVVQTTVTTYADEQIELVTRRVMSTATLTAIVEKFGLYPAITGPDAKYAAAETLRQNTLLETQDAEIANPRSGRAVNATIAFNLSFDHTDPATAQNVAQELADLYLKQNIASRTSQAQFTVDFIQESIDAARADLDKTSEALARFKDLHAGNLPELLNFHLQSIDRTEQQLDNLDREIRESRNRVFTLQTELATTNPLGNATDENGDPILGTADRLAELQTERLRLLSIYTPAHPAVIQAEREIQMLTSGAPAAASAAADVQALRTQLETAMTELQQARQTYTEDHPNVLRLSRSAAVLQQQLEQATTGASAQQSSSSLAALASRDPVVQQLRQQIQTEQTYLQSLTARRAELESKLDEYRRRVAAMPQIEREYEVLVRENEFAATRYNEAVGQLDNAQRAQTIEAEGAGDRFALLEAPLLPSSPYKPNRRVIVLLVILLAVGAGIGLATIIDGLDDAVKDSNELAALIGAPPLAVIPFLETGVDRKRRLTMTIAKSTVFVGGIATAVGIATSMS
jgi:succinoglycan biosynthesis transport protein ExoP